MPLLPLLLTACDQAQGSSAAAKPKSTWAATAVGRIDSEEEARHLVAAADGVIARVLVERGDTIVAGQRLIEIDCAPRLAEANALRADAARAARSATTASSGTLADRAVAEAAVFAARAQLANETAQLQRAEDILARGFIARSAYDTRVQSRAAAEAALSAAQARLTDLDQGRRPAETAEAGAAAFAARQHAVAAGSLAEQCAVKSPVSGQVLQILRRAGEHSGASQGAPLVVVGDLARLVVRAEIGERDAAAVRIGQRAQIWIDGSNQRWGGRVSHVASIMGRRSARSLDPTDRFDRDIREVFIAFDQGTPPALVGLRVTVGLLK
jgi:multidrug resistance efflux pump